MHIQYIIVVKNYTVNSHELNHNISWTESQHDYTVLGWTLKQSAGTFRANVHINCSQIKNSDQKGYVDIVDMTTMTMYEIEFATSANVRNRKIEQYRQPGFEIIIVDCSKLPNDIDAMMEYIERYVVLG